MSGRGREVHERAESERDETISIDRYTEPELRILTDGPVVTRRGALELVLEASLQQRRYAQFGYEQVTRPVRFRSVPWEIPGQLVGTTAEFANSCERVGDFSRGKCL